MDQQLPTQDDPHIDHADQRSTHRHPQNDESSLPSLADVSNLEMTSNEHRDGPFSAVADPQPNADEPQPMSIQNSTLIHQSTNSNGIIHEPQDGKDSLKPIIPTSDSCLPTEPTQQDASQTARPSTYPTQLSSNLDVPNGSLQPARNASPQTLTEKVQEKSMTEAGDHASVDPTTAQPANADSNGDRDTRVAESSAPVGQDGQQCDTDQRDCGPLIDGRRPESLLFSPLTHPNGESIFPNLSTPEQEVLSQEAFAQAEASIVADSFGRGNGGPDDSDGGYDSDGFSSGSTSAESSVRDYMYENGRRYHRFREGMYNFPNDDVEQEREDMKHAMVKLLCSQKLHFAPIGNNPQEVLDLGTGTGIWAIEMGDMYPSAHVLGIDLSPIQPDWLPPNVRFMVDDMESPWLHPRNHFDYIHSRHTVMAVKDWSRLFRRSLENLKPGGWIELQEIHHRPLSASLEGTVPEDHPVARFWTLVTQGLAALDVNLDISSGGHLANMMQEVGYTSVTERVFHVPIGTWPKNKVLKTVGLYWRTILLDGLQAIALGPLTRGLRWNREQVELLLMDVRRAYHDNSALMYMPLHIVYGQKPSTAY